jgi:hypothetical protein
MRKTNVWNPVVAAAIAALLAACGGASAGSGAEEGADEGGMLGDAATPSAATGSASLPVADHESGADQGRDFPCGLLTDAEVQRVGGVTGGIEVESESPLPDTSRCGWMNQRQDFVILTLSDCGTAPDGTRGACAWVDAAAERIAGIGRDAWVIRGEEPFLGVWEASAWTGDRLLSVMVRSPAPGRDAAVTLLRSAFERL